MSAPMRPELQAKLADAIISRLNELIQDVYVCRDIERLFERRIEPSDATKQHPDLQVPDEGFGALGLLNGVIGAIPDGPKKGWGYITAEYNDDGYLTRFKRT